MDIGRELGRQETEVVEVETDGVGSTVVPRYNGAWVGIRNWGSRERRDCGKRRMQECRNCRN